MQFKIEIPDDIAIEIALREGYVIEKDDKGEVIKEPQIKPDGYVLKGILRNIETSYSQSMIEVAKREAKERMSEIKFVDEIPYEKEKKNDTNRQ